MVATEKPMKSAAKDSTVIDLMSASAAVATTVTPDMVRLPVLGRRLAIGVVL